LFSRPVRCSDLYWRTAIAARLGEEGEDLRPLRDFPRSQELIEPKE